jgi:uncharacterized protein YecT (DUF1311 family)
MLFLLVVLFSFMLHGAAFAQVPTFEQIREECADLGFPGAMATCFLEKDREIGAELAATYNRLRRCYSRARAAELVASQRAWLRYQEKSCRLEERAIAFEGPSIARRAYAGCLLEMTIARATKLQDLAEWHCGGPR